MTDQTDRQDPDEWLDLRQVAKKLKVTDRAVQRWIVEGRLVAIKLANKRWVEPAALDDFVARLRAEAAKEATRRRSTRARRSRGRGPGGASDVA